MLEYYKNQPHKIKSRTLLQINVVVNSGSTGRIAEEIGQKAILSGWQSYVAYARNERPSKSKLIRIGNDTAITWHGIQTRLFDKHGLGSQKATLKLIEEIKAIEPDIIHLHNIHGYYINYPILFNFIKKINIPVVWTLHDCWPFTGHCSHFSFAKCERWKRECYDCPLLRSYPASIGLDRSRKNHQEKKKYFSSIDNLTLVPVSDWLVSITKMSFLRDKQIHRIYNGVDTTIFKPKADKQKVFRRYNIKTAYLVVGVASIWGERKGLTDFIALSKRLSSDISILLVGLSANQIKSLPPNIIGVTRTESMEQLAEIYSAADVFINSSLEETFGLTTAESLACGTPAIVFNSTACPEIVSPKSGFVVKPKDIDGLLKAINTVKSKGKSFYTDACRQRAVSFFRKEERYDEYIQLYNNLLENHKK